MALQKGRVRPNGERIRQLREEKGWTQEELVNKAKIKSVKTISNIESSRPCFLATINDIATALGVHVASIVQPPPGEPVTIELDVERCAATSKTRAIGIEPKRPTLAIGDRIQIRCRISRACHLWLVNLGVSGNETTLLPNQYARSVFLSADEWHLFPGQLDRFSFPVLGPPGVETVIAIATNRSVTPPMDVKASTLVIGDEIVDVAKVTGPAYVLGISTIEFDVSKQARE